MSERVNIGASAPLNCGSLPAVATEAELTAALNAAFEAAILSDIEISGNGVVENAYTAVVGAITEVVTDPLTAVASITTFLDSFPGDLFVSIVGNSISNFGASIKNATINIVTQPQYQALINEDFVGSFISNYTFGGDVDALVNTLSEMDEVTAKAALLSIFTETFTELGVAIDASLLNDIVNGIYDFIIDPATAASLSTGIQGAIDGGLLGALTNTEIIDAIADVEAAAAARAAAGLGGDVSAALSTSIECIVNGVVKNTVDEVILNALNELISSGILTQAELISGIEGSIIPSNVLTALADSLAEADLFETIRDIVMDVITIESIGDELDADGIIAAISAAASADLSETLITAALGSAISPASIDATLDQVIMNAVLDNTISADLAAVLNDDAVCAALKTAFDLTVSEAVTAENLRTGITGSITSALTTLVNSQDLVNHINIIYLQKALNSINGTSLAGKYEFSFEKL